MPAPKKRSAARLHGPAASEGRLLDDGTRDTLRDIVSFADRLVDCTDEHDFYRRAVEFARDRLGLRRCAIWLREGDLMRGTCGTSRAGITTDERTYAAPMDEMWRHIFAAAAASPRWQRYEDAALYEWDGAAPQPFARGWLAATPILKHDRRVAVLTNDAAGTEDPCRPDLQQLVETYCAMLGHVLVRRDVQQRMHHSERFARATLDALAESVCVVDGRGAILAVNEAWRAFSLQNQGDPRACAEGANYLEACRRAAENGDDAAGRFLGGFADVRDGRRSEFAMEYACASPETQRWFTARVRRFGTNGQTRFTVAHSDITPLKRAEQQLADQVRYYESLIHNSLDLIAVLDRTGRVLMVNDAVRSVLGYAPADLEGKVVFDYLHPTDRAVATGEIARTLEGARDRELLVFRFRHADGSWRDIEARGATIPGEDTRLLVTARDISDRRRSESLRAAVRRLSDASLTAPTAQDLFEAIHRVVDDVVSAQNFYVALYDAARDELSFPFWVDEHDPVSGPKRPGKGFTEYVLGRGQATLITPEVQARLLAEGEVEQLGHPAAYWLGAPLRVGQEIRGVVAVQSYDPGHALTERDRVALDTLSTPIAAAIVSREREAARVETDQALRQSEEQARVLRTALASAANGVVITDHRGAIVYVNQAFTNLTGYEPAEVLGRNPSVLKSGLHDAAFYRAMWEQVGAGRVWRGEVTNRRKNGTLYWEEMTITPVRDGAGNLTHFIAIKQDVTEQKSLQEQLLQAQKMESIGRLAGGIAHDFNNLLQAITGFSSILMGELGEGDPRRHDVEEIERAAQRAIALTRQLLAFSRKQAIALVPCDLNASVLGTEKMLRRLIGEDIALRTRLASDLPAVRADPGQVEQIIMNLAVNARDAMPQGGTLTLATAARDVAPEDRARAPDARPGRFVRLRVSDTGTGMTPAVRQRLFEPFFSTKGAGRGTGLGLAVVYGIVRQHEGFIDVDSQQGRGTTVDIYLPVATGAEPAPAPDAATDPVEPGQLAGRGESILVVEDEAGVRDFAVRLLRDHGYRVTSSAGIQEARALLDEAPDRYALVFSDVVLPDGNGIALADELRGRHPGVRIVLTSAYSEDQSQWPAIERRRHPFIAKPYQQAALLRLLRQVLDAPVGGRGAKS